MTVTPEDVPAVTPPSAPIPESFHELSVIELREALSDIGHNRKGELVYTRCTLSARHLSSLTGLARYCNLQQLVLDNNALTELTAVQHMPQLVYLSARYNKLTSDVFESLANAGECLERLHLDSNCLTSLSGLEALPYITDLTCSHNAIEDVSARCLSAAQRLMRLRLDHNRISDIDVNAFDAARHLRLLELDHNALSNVAFLHSVSGQVERLALADNRIESLDSAVQHLTGLTILDVRRNALRGLEELRALRSLTSLRILYFDGNDALAHLPPTWGPQHGVTEAALLPTGRTEYHAEVVMSDDEGEDGEDGEDGVMSASGYMDEHSRTVRYDHSAFDREEGGGQSSNPQHNFPPRTRGKGSGESPNFRHLPAAALTAAAPTTASYVALAAPETHDFIRTVGTATRDAELSVKVNKVTEVQALPEEEQVYLWTLSLLPHLQELNERSISPADVARANFLFASLAAS